MPDQRPKWALGSDQYAKRARVGAAPSQPSRRHDPHLFEDTGITWDEFDYAAISTSTVERSRHRFRAALPELIWNTAALEGNNFTLPEVKTLLEGVTVGGKKMDDENQIVALSKAYNRLDELVGAGKFALTKEVTDELHGLTARHEAIESGKFRGEGAATGGGNVRLSTGGVVEGTPHGPGGTFLTRHYDDLIRRLSSFQDARERALLYFASATRRQFHFDGNKRTARLMMTGELMAHGFDIVSIPYARQLEFNNALDTLFSTDDATEILRFLTTCTFT